MRKEANATKVAIAGLDGRTIGSKFLIYFSWGLTLGTVAKYIVERWKNVLAASDQFFKIDFAIRTYSKGEDEMDYFKFTFATWHSMYLTGKYYCKLTSPLIFSTFFSPPEILWHDDLVSNPSFPFSG